MTHGADRSTAADDLRRWLDDDTVPPRSAATDDAGTVARGSRRRATVAALILVPWIAVLVVIVVSGRTASPGGTTAGGHTARPGHAAPPTVDAGRDRGAPPTAGPVAVGVVRDALTRGGDAATTAVDVAAAEPPRAVADDVWVVRVHAVVLGGDRRRWRTRSHEVWAVPIGGRGGAAVALDRPWRVGRGDPLTAPVRWRPAHVDDDDVRDALRRAGLSAPRDLVVERHPDLDVVLRATGRTARGDVHVWLRAAPTLEVLGSDDAVAMHP